MRVRPFSAKGCMRKWAVRVLSKLRSQAYGAPMSNHSSTTISRTLLAILCLVMTAATAGATEWQVARSSGEVWVATPQAQTVSLDAQVVLKPGDKVQTGRNGRVLLVRGAETILIAPNSVVGLPEEQKAGRTTTILQQAGSIVLEVEKRNVEHFEVETPYLAAVVKGTRFSVTVSRLGADVRVLSGSVDVSAFKTGQSALLVAGQVARVASSGSGGLTLGGGGRLGPVQQGAPQKATLERVRVPARGLGPPTLQSGKGERQALSPAGGATHAATVVRIVNPIGLGQLNIPALTKGLARSSSSSRSTSAQKGSAAAPTIWEARAPEGTELGNANANGNGNGGGPGNSNAGGNGSASANASGAASGKGKSKGKGP